MIRTLPSKTVVFRLSSIGDIVLTSPLLRLLRAAVGPEARVDFVVKKEYAELVRFSHHLSVVHELDTSKGYGGLQEIRKMVSSEAYDLVIDLHNNLRTIYLRNFSGAKEVVVLNKRTVERWQLVHLKRRVHDLPHAADRYIESVSDFGIMNDGKGLEIFIPDKIQFRISAKLARLKLNMFPNVIGLCPGAKHFTKRWQKEKFAEVGVRAAQDLKSKILLFGSPDDAGTCSFITSEIRRAVGENAATDFSGQFSLLETAAAMDFCDVILTNDSGLMHLAAARRRKVVAIFGSTVRELGFAPYGTESAIVENKGLQCRPCTHIGRPECPLGHFKCMTEIESDGVYRALSSFSGG